jgi:hypothetical protein
VKAAKAQRRTETALPGRIQFVSYAIADEGSSLLLSADLAVTFADAPKPTAARGPAASQPVVEKKHNYEEDEPGD